MHVGLSQAQIPAAHAAAGSCENRRFEAATQLLGGQTALARVADANRVEEGEQLAELRIACRRPGDHWMQRLKRDTTHFPFRVGPDGRWLATRAAAR
jgi:hypothetical protein